jgi:hypothetical protein
LVKEYQGWMTFDDMLYQLQDEYHVVIVAKHNVHTGVAIG